ncbi:hypothetical protein [Alkalicoccobacillus murimartini]|uniref:Heme/copper-type cytochrome/quinol oxidase subunit 4 n=1 Tax=Alkalicoccobacillus murimartini TaxID=171685 RepID=A0ABT9YEI6_9BACI|nr:hypothetical protein [Alkalicoccobacillus murimartini]MDQ0206252.1 heme/copper-type cytochrome/quinol oxidase subunit 4 [Alkalicoccobacillus murimartini]
MKGIQNVWPWFVLLSVVIFVLAFFTDNKVLDASWCFIAAITYLMILLDIRKDSKNIVNMLAFIFGGLFILSVIYQGIRILM